MFGKKQRKIEELEKKIKKLEFTIECQEDAIKDYKKKFDELEELKDSVPDDCVRGAWCKACGFVKHFYVFHNGLIHNTITVCGKGQSCEHFVPQEVNTDA